MQTPTLQQILQAIVNGQSICPNLIAALVILFTEDDHVDLKKVGMTLGKFVQSLPQRLRVCDAINSTLYGSSSNKRMAWVTACSQVGCLPICDPQWAGELSQLIVKLRNTQTDGPLTQQQIFELLGL